MSKKLMTTKSTKDTVTLSNFGHFIHTDLFSELRAKSLAIWAEKNKNKVTEEQDPLEFK